MKKEDLIKFYRKYQLFIFPTVVALSSLSLIIFIIFPQAVKTFQEKDTAQSLNRRAGFLEAKAQTLEGYEKEDLLSKVTSALFAYPQDRDFVTTIGLLQELTNSSSFSVISLTFGGGQVEQTTPSYLVKLEILGPRILLDDLLKNLENSLRVMKVQSLDVSPSPSAQMVNVSLGVEVFYQALPGALGDLDSPLPQFTKSEEELLVKLAVSQPTQAPGIPAAIGPRGKENPFE